MNINYGLGSLLGAVVALVLIKLDIDLAYAFFGLAIMTVFPTVLVAMLPNPHSYYGRDEHQTLLSFEDPTRRVPTVPSPIVGGVFLHAQHISGSKNCSPDTYDSKNNFIILLVTIFATVLFGIQLGLAAFLYDYIGTVLTDGAKLAAAQIPGSDITELGERPKTGLIADLEEIQRFDFDEELLPEDSWEPDTSTNQYEVEAILDDELPLSTSTSRSQRKFKVK
ncbi:hypothetical protein PInf_002615 [Phytophthora infestans]|nr:hypothetical protein PInf_002615 [Phytophthora infestans]